MVSRFNFDNIHIGSSGFAQVGEFDYYIKQQIEAGVLLEHIRKTYPMPKEIEHVAILKWGSNSHDFGIYHELEVKYIQRTVEDWEVEEDPRFDIFWDWINTLECIDFEAPELIEKMENLYQTQLEIDKKDECIKKKEYVRS